MKNYFKPLFWFCLLATFAMQSHAQNTVINAETTMFKKTKIPYEDSLNKALQKYGIKLTENESGDQQCSKIGDVNFIQPFRRFNPGKMSDSMTTIYERNGAIRDTSGGYNDPLINIIWLHGLNGTTNSLRAAATATELGVDLIGFKARRVRSIIGTRSSMSHQVQFYNEDLGLTAASNDLNTYCRINIPVNERTNKDFIIAHSQGGLVGREWLRNMERDPKHFEKLAHGLVTIGTSHGGAQILNNCLPQLGNKVPSFMKEACTALGKAQVTPMLNGNFITRIVISKNFEDKIVSATCNAISKTVIPLALDNYYKATAADFYVGAPFLNGYTSNNRHVEGLSEYTLKVPMVQFYGVEEQPILWKFLSSTAQMGHDIMDLNLRYFAYDKDDQVELEVIKYIAELDAKIFAEEQRIEYHKKRIYLFSIPIAGPIVLIDAAMKIRSAQENKAAYLGAKTWLSNANNTYLLELVGAKEWKTTKYCEVIDYLKCRSNDYNPISSSIPPVELEVKIKLSSPAINGNCGYTSGNVSAFYRNYEFLDGRGIRRLGSCDAKREVIESYKFIKEISPNDGVVLTESSAAPIKVDANQSYFIIEMPKTNHEQMKNSNRTRIALDELYKGTYGNLFKIRPR